MKKRILVHFVLVLSAAIVATMVLMILLTYNMFEQRVMEDLRVDARVISAMLSDGTDAVKMNTLGGDLRVTIIGADGVVDYDNRADSDMMDSHLDRPEVLAALNSGEGQDIRNSKTVERSTFYYALRLESGSVLRVAKEASSIASVYMRAVPLILLVMLAMVGLSVAAASALTERLIRPIEGMTRDMRGADEKALYPELRPVLRMIRSQHEEIIRSADMRVEFTANVSHELKTPLTSISGYAELIESGMAEEKQARRFAGEIRKSANRLLDLINDIISLSRLDNSEHAIVMGRVDLAHAVRTAAEQLQSSAQRAGVTMTLDVRSAIVSGNERMLEELAYNLCDNAIRYNVSGGSVRVQVHPVREHVMLIVQDTGIGISKENQERVFERFYRVDKSRSKATGGTGLGLAIVKHIAAKHEAEIELESKPGSGTTITVTFRRET